MGVTLELTDDEAEELSTHLDKAYGTFRLMSQEAEEAGDKHAAADYWAKAQTAIDLRKKVIRQFDKPESSGNYWANGDA